MSEETMTQFKTEGQPAFPVENRENDNSTDSSTDKTDADPTQSQGGESNPSGKKEDSENFANHPRWKERENDWTSRFNEQERRHVDELTRLRTELDQRFNSLTPKGTPSEEIPAWFGGDADQWGQFLAWNNSLTGKVKDEARAEVLKEIETKSAEEQKKIDEATSYMNQEIATIESDKELNPQGQSIDRNKLLKFVLDNDLVDTKGRWNYKAAFKMMGAQAVFKAKESLNERRQLANAITSEKKAETPASTFMTSADFSKPGARPW